MDNIHLRTKLIENTRKTSLSFCITEKRQLKTTEEEETIVTVN